jgi:uncharacterized membrane protein YqjE
MAENEHAGLLASIRRMAETLLSAVQNRIELFATELQEEKCWLISTLLWAAAAVFFCGVAILFVVGTVVYLSPEGARPWVLGGFSVLFVYLAINAVVGLRRSLRDKPPPLADTIGELKKDLEWIRSRD